MQIILFIATIAFFCAPPAYADRAVYLPDGQMCWQSENGHVWGCSGSSAARRPSREELEYQRPAPTNCIELQSELDRIQTTMRRGFSATLGNELRRKRNSYEQIFKKNCR